MNNSKKIDTFRQYCKQALEEENRSLKEKKDSPLLKGKLARIQLFNEHLAILKQELQDKVTEIIGASQYTSIDEYHGLEDTLNDIVKDTVNDYLFNSFPGNNNRQ
jgi:hypothetical protein